MDKDEEEKLLTVCNKAAAGILDALASVKMPALIKMGVLGGCLAEVIKELPQEAQMPAFIHHMMALRSSCGFENEVGVMQVPMPEKESPNAEEKGAPEGVTKH